MAFDRHVVGQAQQMFHNLAFLETYVEMISNYTKAAKTSEDIERGEKLKDLEQPASEELLNGIGLYCELVTAVACKPLT